MNDTTMTIVGNLVDEPKLRRTKNQHAVTTFRVASTSRRFSREEGRFVDNSTLFVSVSCWRALAENAFDSLHKGQQVVVTGRYYQREYEVNEAKRLAYELEATSIGHDLARGVTEFRKMVRVPVTGSITLDEDGIPADESDHYLDLDDDADLADEMGAERFAHDGIEASATAQKELAGVR